MNIIWGVVLIIFSLLAWGGQIITAFSPKIATKIGLAEPESDVDPTFYIDIRGESLWDTLILWTLPVAGILLLINSNLWIYFGLVGGGMYLYFAGRGIIVRLVMEYNGIRIGNRKTLKTIYLFLTMCGLIAIITIILAVIALPLPT
ncbi:hypothetical protein ACFLS9_08845 [Bacteroidota bacterium]